MPKLHIFLQINSTYSLRLDVLSLICCLHPIYPPVTHKLDVISKNCSLPPFPHGISLLFGCFDFWSADYIQFVPPAAHDPDVLSKNYFFTSKPAMYTTFSLDIQGRTSAIASTNNFSNTSLNEAVSCPLQHSKNI